MAKRELQIAAIWVSDA